MADHPRPLPPLPRAGRSPSSPVRAALSTQLADSSVYSRSPPTPSLQSFLHPQNPPDDPGSLNSEPPPVVSPPSRPLSVIPEPSPEFLLANARPPVALEDPDKAGMHQQGRLWRQTSVSSLKFPQPTRIIIPPPSPPQVIRVTRSDRTIPPSDAHTPRAPSRNKGFAGMARRTPLPPSTYAPSVMSDEFEDSSIIPPSQAHKLRTPSRNKGFADVAHRAPLPPSAYAPTVLSDEENPGMRTIPITSSVPIARQNNQPQTRKVGSDGPPRLLCFDGSGGVRGLSSLLLLKEFLYRVAKSKGFTGDGSGKVLPCEYFDMICGTGTGGLIAIMLGKLQMTVDEAIEQYLKLSKRIFSKKKWIWKEGRYSARNLELAIKNIVGERALILKLPGYDLPSTSLEDRGKRIMMRESKSDPKLCKVFVCARQVNDSCEEVNIRSYSLEKTQQEDLTIWEAARATTAAPYFFKPLRILAGNGRRVGGVYIDAAVGYNNPIKRLLVEARQEFPGMENAFILSLGSGVEDLIHLPRSPGFPAFQRLQALKFLQKVAVDCESVHQDVSKQLRQTPYFRLNVDRGVQGISHDAWNQVDAIHQYTMAYMQRGETDTYVDLIVDAFLGKRGATSESPRPLSPTPRPRAASHASVF